MNVIQAVWLFLLFGSLFFVIAWWTIVRRHRAAIDALGLWTCQAVIDAYLMFSCWAGHGRCGSTEFNLVPIGLSLITISAIAWVLARTPDDRTPEA